MSRILASTNQDPSLNHDTKVKHVYSHYLSAVGVLEGLVTDSVRDETICSHTGQFIRCPPVSLTHNRNRPPKKVVWRSKGKRPCKSVVKGLINIAVFVRKWACRLDRILQSRERHGIPFVSAPASCHLDSSLDLTAVELPQ